MAEQQGVSNLVLTEQESTIQNTIQPSPPLVDQERTPAVVHHPSCGPVSPISLCPVLAKVSCLRIDGVEEISFYKK